MPVRFFNPYEQLFQGLQNLGLGGVQGVNRPYMIEEQLKNDPGYRSGIVGAARAIYAKEGDEGLAKFQANLGMRPDTPVLRDFVLAETPEERAGRLVAGATAEGALLDQEIAGSVREMGGGAAIAESQVESARAATTQAKAQQDLIPTETRVRLQSLGIQEDAQDAYAQLISQQPPWMQAIANSMIANPGFGEFLARERLTEMEIAARFKAAQQGDPNAIIELTAKVMDGYTNALDRARDPDLTDEQRRTEAANVQRWAGMLEQLQNEGAIFPGDLAFLSPEEKWKKEDLVQYGLSQARATYLTERLRELDQLPLPQRVQELGRAIEMIPENTQIADGRLTRQFLVDYRDTLLEMNQYKGPGGFSKFIQRLKGLFDAGIASQGVGRVNVPGGR